MGPYEQCITPTELSAKMMTTEVSPTPESFCSFATNDVWAKSTKAV